MSLSTQVNFLPIEDSHQIEEAARERLRKSSYSELRLVRCSMRERSLQLRGTVSSYYLRQLAQTALRGLDGVEYIDNQLKVEPRSDSR